MRSEFVRQAQEAGLTRPIELSLLGNLHRPRMRVKLHTGLLSLQQKDSKVEAPVPSRKMQEKESVSVRNAPRYLRSKRSCVGFGKLSNSQPNANFI